MTAPVHPHELQRLVSVCGLGIVPAGPDPLLDRAAAEAAAVCGASIGLVTLVGERDQTFLGCVGLDGPGTAREESFCAHTILQNEPTVVEDARGDARFADLALVTKEPFIRFYAGAPVVDVDGLPLGSVCVLDPTPRTISMNHLIKLQRLATAVGVVLAARRAVCLSMGTNVRTPGVESAMKHLDQAMAPLFSSTNGFRSFVG